MGRAEIIQIIILGVLIIMSSFFSATETAYSSANPIKLKSLSQQGHSGALRALKLTERFDRVLIAILIGNNIVNIAAASLATVLFVQYWGDLGVTISTAVMTVLVLIFGEITPKSLAKEIPERFAIAVSPILILLIWILTPLIIIFGYWQKLMNRLFDFKKGDGITEDEILTLVEEAKEEGGINENERQLIRSVIDFDELTVEDILTPRVDVIAIHIDDSEQDIADVFKETGYSRLPIYDKDIDHIIGTINHKDFYQLVLLENQKIETIINEPVYVTEYMKIPNLLALLKENKAHMAIVRDEFGGTQGVVTMEDILEELVGDIWDEHDEIVEEITRLSEDAYQVKGQADLETFFEVVGLIDPVEHVTINGWVMEQMGKIPEIGEQFVYKNLHVSIINADEKRVIDVIVKILSE